ncbi:MAG: histidine triad nucleotide-binding protein [Patescibacteria group bacterium]|nr:histidine triad nucleotide-binding protein [Patescibacteria group bacterium]
MDNCLFCRISNGEIPTKFEYEDDEIAAFADINPKAPVHILIVPKKHIPSIAEVTDEDTELLGKMIMVAKKLAEVKGIANTGYRLVFNTRKHAGQIVDHIHLHLLGGKVLGSMA